MDIHHGLYYPSIVSVQADRDLDSDLDCERLRELSLCQHNLSHYTLNQVERSLIIISNYVFALKINGYFTHVLTRNAQ